MACSRWSQHRIVIMRGHIGKANIIDRDSYSAICRISLRVPGRFGAAHGDGSPVRALAGRWLVLAALRVRLRWCHCSMRAMSASASMQSRAAVSFAGSSGWASCQARLWPAYRASRSVRPAVIWASVVRAVARRCAVGGPAAAYQRHVSAIWPCIRSSLPGSRMPVIIERMFDHGQAWPRWSAACLVGVRRSPTSRGGWPTIRPAPPRKPVTPQLADSTDGSGMAAAMRPEPPSASGHSLRRPVGG
jgi:hypothetical protein